MCAAAERHRRGLNSRRRAKQRVGGMDGRWREHNIFKNLNFDVACAMFHVIVNSCHIQYSLSRKRF